MTEATADGFWDRVTSSLLLQIALVANKFHLLQNLQPDGSNLNDNSIAVGGLRILTLVDADYWIASGLNLAFLGYSEHIPIFPIK